MEKAEKASKISFEHILLAIVAISPLLIYRIAINYIGFNDFPFGIGLTIFGSFILILMAAHQKLIMPTLGSNKDKLMPPPYKFYSQTIINGDIDPYIQSITKRLNNLEFKHEEIVEADSKEITIDFFKESKGGSLFSNYVLNYPFSGLIKIQETRMGWELQTELELTADAFVYEQIIVDLQKLSDYISLVVDECDLSAMPFTFEMGFFLIFLFQIVGMVQLELRDKSYDLEAIIACAISGLVLLLISLLSLLRQQSTPLRTKALIYTFLAMYIVAIPLLGIGVGELMKMQS
jgi:hypothetical protein